MVRTAESEQPGVVYSPEVSGNYSNKIANVSAKVDQIYGRVEKLSKLEKRFEGLEVGLSEIQSKVEEIRLTSTPLYRRFGHWVKNVSSPVPYLPITIAVLGLIVGTGAGFKLIQWVVDSYIANLVDAKLKPINDKLTAHGESLAGIKAVLQLLSPQIVAVADGRLKAVARSPMDPASQRTAKDLVAAARQADISIPSETIKEVGARFIEASSPGAWDVGMDFLGLRATLNGSLPQPILGRARGQGKWKLDIPTKRNEAGSARHITVTLYGSIEAERAVIADELLSPLNQDEKVGPSFAVVESDGSGVVLEIDGHRLRNMLFRNMVVQYAGGPVELGNVHFVNCSFRLKRNDEAIRLAMSILEAPAVSLRMGFSSMYPPAARLHPPKQSH